MSTYAPITAAKGWFIGEDKTMQFAVSDSNGDPQNMTGWALEWVIRRAPESSSTLITTKTTGAGDITLSNGLGTNDYALVTIADADTVGLAPATYHYTLRRTDDGSEQVLAYGEAVLQQADTR